MDNLTLISIPVLGTINIITLLLVLRLIRWQKLSTAKRIYSTTDEMHKLIIGSEAPEFRARNLLGEPVRLENFLGSQTAFIFVSPRCGLCRKEIPDLARLEPLAMKNGKAKLVLVSDGNSEETGNWVNSFEEDIKLPIIVAPGRYNDFIETYNPEWAYPSYCLLSENNTVIAHGKLSSTSPEWRKLKRTWEGVTQIAPWITNQP